MRLAPALSVRGLSVSFFTEDGVIRAVQDVAFSVRKGRTLALVGESGCGKTTVALAIMQLLPGLALTPQRAAQPQPIMDGVALNGDATRGQVLHNRTIGAGRGIVTGEAIFEGQNLLVLGKKPPCFLAKARRGVESMRQIRGNKIAMIFQEPMTSLNPVYTVGDQIVEAIKLHQKKNTNEAWEDAVELLRTVGIANPEQRAHEYPHQMSGGMQQRIMIAMAISCEPTLLIADEPTTALDVTIQAQILDLLDELQNQNGMSILLITHDLSVVAERADDVAVMYASRIVEMATCQQLFTAPFHPYTRGLLQCLPRVGLSAKRLQTIPGAVPEPLHFPTGCKFHPRCRIGCNDNRCQTVEPELREVQPGRWAACWYAPA